MPGFIICVDSKSALRRFKIWPGLALRRYVMQVKISKRRTTFILNVNINYSTFLSVMIKVMAKFGVKYEPILYTVCKKKACLTADDFLIISI